MGNSSEPQFKFRNRFIIGTLFNFLAIVFNQGSTMLINIVVARILLKENFGVYAMIYSTLIMLVSLTQLSAGNTSAKFVAEFREVDSRKTGQIIGVCFAMSMGLAIFISTLFFFVSPWLAENIFSRPNLAKSLRLGVIYIFFSSLNSFQTGTLAGFEAFRALAYAGSFSGFLNVMGVSFGAFFGGLNGALFGLGLGSIFRFLIHRAYMQHYQENNRVTMHPVEGFIRQKGILFKFSFPSAISGTLSMIVSWYVMSYLAKQENGFNEVSLYSASANFKMMVIFLPMVINSVSTSLLNNAKGLGKVEPYQKVFRTNLLGNMSISVGFALFIGIFGERVLEVFGKGFADGKTALVFLLIAGVFEVVGTSVYQHIYAQGKLWLTFGLIIVPRDITLLLSAFYLAPVYGAAGLAMAVSLSFFVALILIILLKIKLPLFCEKTLDTSS